MLSEMEKELWDLDVKINSANSPMEIDIVVSAIDSHLKCHPAYQNVQFFSCIFPNLIAKLFGFSNDDIRTSPMPVSWIDTASFDTSADLDLIGKLFTFLSPCGTLITSMLPVDDLSRVNYVFPTERLPFWFCCPLSSHRFRQILYVCPLFKDRVCETEPGSIYKFCVRLNVFDYYLFWFAYFPIFRGYSSEFDVDRRTSSSLPIDERFKQILQQSVYCPLYLRLLYAYLRAFVPILGQDSQSCHDSPAEFVVTLFVHYWLSFNDCRPLAMDVCYSLGVVFPSWQHWRGIPASYGLGEVVELLVKYLNLSMVLVRRVGITIESHGSSSRNKLSCADSETSMEIVSWNVTIQRPLYRLRTFLYWPIGSSMRNISKVFSAWTTYIEQWKLSENEFLEFEVNNNTARDGVQVSQLQYSKIWEDYVLSNYLFYTSLVTHFVRFGLKFLDTDADVIVPMVSKIMDILTSSRQLLDLLKNVDAAYHSIFSEGGKSTDANLCKFLPRIHAQLQDWQDDFGERDVYGSFLRHTRYEGLRLFQAGEDGGRQLFEHFICRAEYEIQSVSNENLTKHLLCVQSLKLQFFYLFDVPFTDRPPQYHPTIQWLRCCVKRLMATMMVTDFFGNVKSD